MADRQPTTFIEQAIQTATDEAQGRWAKAAPTFPGGTKYPRQGEDSPWSQGQSVPPEAPYPTDINFVPPVGEFHERGEVAPPSSSPFSEGGAAPQGSDPAVTSGAVEPAPGETISEEGVPDGWPRRSDGFPMSSPPQLKRRA
jgi:hypothetical protein